MSFLGINYLHDNDVLNFESYMGSDEIGDDRTGARFTNGCKSVPDVGFSAAERATVRYHYSL